MIKYYTDKGRIMLRVRTQKNKQKYQLDYFPGLSSDGFDPVTQRYENTGLNNEIMKISLAVTSIIEQYGIENLTPDTFRTLVEGKLKGGKNSFFSFADSWYFEMKERKGFEWSKQINTCINLLKDFAPDATFDKVDKLFLKKLLIYLEKKNYTTNTIGSVIKNLKRIMTAATEAGLNTNMTFVSFKRLQEDADNIYLTEDEIERIYRLNLTPELIRDRLKVKDVVKKIRALGQARKLFIIGCWTGLRVGNYNNIDLKQISEKHITVIANKGGDKLKIPLHWMVREIIGSGWPAPMFEQKINVQIKDLGKLAEINDEIIYYRTEGGKRKEYRRPKYELIKTHTARRSFASNMTIRGVPSKYIMAITGHKTERDFNRYTASVRRDLLTEKIAEYGVWDKS